MSKSTELGYLYRRGNVWWVRFGVSGKRRAYSLDTEEKEVAEERRKTLATAVHAMRQQDEWTKRTQDIIASLTGLRVVSTAPTPNGGPQQPSVLVPDPVLQGQDVTLSQVWLRYTQSPKRPPSSPATLFAYSKVWDRLKGWSEKQGIKTLLDIAPHAQTYSLHLDSPDVGLTAGTVNKSLSFLRTLWRVLLSSPTPFDGLRSKRHDTPESYRPLDDTEIYKAYSDATGEFQTFIGLSILTGARLTDVVHLKYSDLINGEIHFTPEKTKRFGLKLSIPLPKSFLKPQKEGYILSGLVKAYKHSPQEFSKRVQNYLNGLGINSDVRGLVAHRSFRHSVETILGRSGIAQPVIDSILGHNPKRHSGSAAVYRSISVEEKKQAIKLLEKILKF